MKAPWKKVVLMVAAVSATSTLTALQFKWLGWVIGKSADPIVTWGAALSAGVVTLLVMSVWVTDG